MWDSIRPLWAVFGVGPTELVILAGVALLCFSHRLPAALRGLGQSYREFRDALRGNTLAAKPEQEVG